MKASEMKSAIKMREAGSSINEISQHLGVSKSSVSTWVRNVTLSDEQRSMLIHKGFSKSAIEKRRQSRLKSEAEKRELVISVAERQIQELTLEKLLLIGTMLYWAEGGKTKRMVRFSNGDPRMIEIMMVFFRKVCKVPEHKFRGYIHIHPHLDSKAAEQYWSRVSDIPLSQFYKTYNKKNVSSKNKRHSLPYGVFDIYILDAHLFDTITGWARGIFRISQISFKENIPLS